MHKPVQEKFILKNNSPETQHGPNTSKNTSTLTLTALPKQENGQSWEENGVRLWGASLGFDSRGTWIWILEIFTMSSKVVVYKMGRITYIPLLHGEVNNNAWCIIETTDYNHIIYIWLWRLTNPKICHLPKTKENQWYNSSLKIGRLETQLEFEGRKKPTSQIKAIRQEELPFIWGRVRLFILFRPSTDWGGPSALLSPPIQLLNSSRNTRRKTLTIIKKKLLLCSTKYLGTSWANHADSKINHHSAL